MYQIYQTEGNNTFTKRNTGINEGMSINTGVKISADNRYTGIKAQNRLLSGIRYERSKSNNIHNIIKIIRPDISEIKTDPDMNESF